MHLRLVYKSGFCRNTSEYKYQHIGKFQAVKGIICKPIRHYLSVFLSGLFFPFFFTFFLVRLSSSVCRYAFCSRKAAIVLASASCWARNSAALLLQGPRSGFELRDL